MAEIRTCEQYVLSRLEELERQNENLKSNLEELINIIHLLNDGVEALKKYIVVEKVNSFKPERNKYITMHDIHAWHTDEKEDLEIIMKAFNLFDLIPEEEVMEDGSGISN